MKPPPRHWCSVCAWHIWKRLADPGSLTPRYKYSVLRHTSLSKHWGKFGQQHTHLYQGCVRRWPSGGSYGSQSHRVWREAAASMLATWSLESKPEVSGGGGGAGAVTGPGVRLPAFVRTALGLLPIIQGPVFLEKLHLLEPEGNIAMVFWPLLWWKLYFLRYLFYAESQ